MDATDIPHETRSPDATHADDTAGGDVDPHAEPVVVATHVDRGEAEVTRAHLAANGITAEIVDEVGGGTVPVDGEAGVLVAVPADQAELARAVLAG